MLIALMDEQSRTNQSVLAVSTKTLADIGGIFI